MITKVFGRDFNIGQILECGQCFRYKLIEENVYEVVAKRRRVRITQINQKVTFDCDLVTFNQHWKEYFDLDRDYLLLLEQFEKKDEHLRKAARSKSGLRILRQEPFEMMMTFIISQNKSMDQIKVLVERLAIAYGDYIEDSYGGYYTFPTPIQLQSVTEQDYRDLKVGFRAPYLQDAVRRVIDGSLCLEAIQGMDIQQARDALMTVKGIGPKVADCILLFGYGMVDVFPVDVWIRRMMTVTYFDEEKVSDKKILAFATSYFDGYAGIAQQYLFYYGRDAGIGVNKR